MKQVRFAAICFLCCIIVSLPSCGLLKNAPEAPKVFDKDFKESFTKDYQRAEPNLMYVSAVITDADVYMEAEQSHEESGGRYTLGVVKNVKDHQFVAAVKQKPIVGRETEYALSLYSRGGSAPVLQSWTIQSVSVVALTEQEFATVRIGEEDVDQTSRSFITNPLQYHMDHGAVELAVFEGAEHQEQLKLLGNSYQTRKAYSNTDIAVQPLCVYLDDATNGSLKCFILVRFEETDSLIWVARLYSDKEGNKLYMDCSEYTDHEVVRLAEIDAAFAELILAQIESQESHQ